MKIQKKEPIVDGKYIFVYLLGNNPSQREIIKQVRWKTGYKIVALQQIDDYIASDEEFADKAPYNVGPKEFLNYIRNAELIFTDSFHCSVFSILYKKKFFTFNRFSERAKQCTNTRIDNLMNITGLQQCRLGNDVNVDEILNKQISFEGVDDKLNVLRAQSMAYLKEALKGL
jgi:exopolysaccharide biosynthesis predicted pyruvyltransferase EpsI